ncbi:ABC transporter substrate-binding protein [Streptomyces badius]
MAGFVPAMDKALGKGTDQGAACVGQVRALEGEVPPGRDAPAYNATGGPQCYSVPYLGKHAPTADNTRAADVIAPPPTQDDGGGADTALGLPNSPQESQLVNELVAPSLKVRPGDLPDWSSVLIGPAFRGAEVKLK